MYVRAYLLGRIGVQLSEGAPPVPMQPAIRSLFAYLLMFRDRPHRRESLVDIFWPDKSPRNARRCLNSAIYRLRQVLKVDDLGDGGSRNEELIQTTVPDEVLFNTRRSLWLDVAEFEAATERGLRPADSEVDAARMTDLESAVELYIGDPLQGIYHDWAVRERDRLEALFLQALYRLMVNHTRLQNWDKAAAFGHRILAIDPLREDIHAQVMRITALAGDRAGAMRQYNLLCQLLSDELGVGPMPETERLRDAIMKDSVPVILGEDGLSAEQAIRQKFRSMRDRLTRLRRFSGDFEAEIDEIERLIYPADDAPPKIDGNG